MKAIDRKSFLKSAGLGALLASSSCGGPLDKIEAEPAAAASIDSLSLRGLWHFRTDPGREGETGNWQSENLALDGWEPVSVPHTWQVTEGLEDYTGRAWYRCAFEAPEAWKNKWVRIEFEAVYHSAVVWLNGVRLGEHPRKGYTAFALDLSPALKPGALNTLAVMADNAFEDRMLPRGTSFDWCNDGGITRPVNLLVTPRVFVEQAWIDAVPRLEQGDALLSGFLRLRNTTQQAAKLEIAGSIKDAATGLTVLTAEAAARVEIPAESTQTVTLPELILPNPRLWHFDHPDLYQFCLEISSGGYKIHRREVTFGVRKFEVADGGFRLNGEPVRLMGVERMAGSNPYYGMAEPENWIVSNHDDLKELNCVFTRIHWQQDRRVFDYCDRHGILIQSEVPTWGADTFSGMSVEPDADIMANALEQLGEMIARDRNHPSIVAWGLCNEIGGQNPPAYRFAENMLAEAKKVDPGRLCTYASNSLQETPENDVAGLMDFIEWNEYYESWYGGGVAEMEANLEAIHRAFPGKPIVISEYGYCQCRPERTEGDRRVVEILKSHTAACRKYPFVGGLIFFSYNDYRTHIGDKGEGACKQRVHGVVDLFGRRKPSFAALREESSPLDSFGFDTPEGVIKVSLSMRMTIPAYRLQAYRLRWTVYGYDKLPMETHERVLDTLAPGDRLAIELPYSQPEPTAFRVEMLRPTGFSVADHYWES